MLSQVKTPNNKVDLIRSIQSLYNPKINTYDIYDTKVMDEVISQLKRLKNRSGVSVVVIQDP